MRYDPLFHGNVVRNLRSSFINRYGHDCRLSDGEMWRVYDEDSGIESDDPDDKELPIYEGLLEREAIEDNNSGV